MTKPMPRISRGEFLKTCCGSSLVCAMLPVMSVEAKGAGAVTDRLTFRGSDYLFRWEGGNQQEFTPQGQEDLQKWLEMMTIVRYPDAHSADRMAEIANNTVALYQKNGKILKVDAVQAKAEKPAIYFAEAALSDVNVLEIAFARLQLVESGGMGAIYSHRFYGVSPGVNHEASAWMDKNGAAIERALMEWTLPAQ
ncbi:hypothetical protein [Acetobacter sp. DsW_063]|uniref:hypothetical protein n=1 Tax=Acetobacter sp. DsW_063 TaxID=1514894 RepID=UPI0018EA066C|nr:hypothetical protein [Acetobacter sp. DsW_063]